MCGVLATCLRRACECVIVHSLQQTSVIMARDAGVFYFFHLLGYRVLPQCLVAFRVFCVDCRAVLSGWSALSGLTGLTGLSGLTGLTGLTGLSGLSGLSGISITHAVYASFYTKKHGQAQTSAQACQWLCLPVRLLHCL